jgi:hypothetical protein
LVKDLPTFNLSLVKLSALFSLVALKVATHPFAEIGDVESIQAVLGCAYFFLAPEFEMSS